jgi:hypothetical protein
MGCNKQVKDSAHWVKAMATELLIKHRVLSIKGIRKSASIVGGALRLKEGG